MNEKRTGSVTEYFFPSSNGFDEICLRAFIPNQEIKGYVQFVHDMYEHISLYDDTMLTFAQNGYFAFGIDHMGHGKSVKDIAELGKFKGNSPFTSLLEDTNRAFLYIFNQYPPNNKETFTRSYKSGILGNKENSIETIKPPIHAMIGVGLGSAIIKNYAIMFKDLNCVILCGDRGNEFKDLFRLIKCNSLIKRYGGEYSAKRFVESIEKKYYTGFPNENRFGYITSDIKAYKKISKDSLCNFEYDLKSYKTILEMEHSMNLGEWAAAYPLFMATYLISGKDDPINNKTKNLNELVRYIRQNRLKNWFYKYYDGYHNLFLDDSKNNVIKDVLKVINAVKEQQYGY